MPFGSPSRDRARSNGAGPVRAGGVIARGAVGYLISAVTFGCLKLFVANGCNWGDDTALSVLLAATLLAVLLTVLGGWALRSRRRLSRAARFAVLLMVLIGLAAIWLIGWYASTLPSGCPV
ncbi:hypothetical protein Athai_43420 [Actinocatenispora thailandica]|uniref:Uncharacterized protein n=2 Tax=Actinocatenispora thailandica TaxID=227318 RepID=A0A7R7DS59_9ACTN|nr:hypothetical protein Athai_43420 [Actinocatenispora thailandica]